MSLVGASTLTFYTVLTVRAHQANSHKGWGWEQFTDQVIRTINAKRTGVVFLLWGKAAQTKGAIVDGKKHLVLKCPHPSGLSAHRGFWGSRHFSKANDYLKKQGREPIRWTALSDKPTSSS